MYRTPTLSEQEKAKLLLDNKAEWAEIGRCVLLLYIKGLYSNFRCVRCRGMILYVSFSKGAEAKNIRQAVETLLSLPIVSLGVWGDDNKPQPFTELLRDGKEVQVGVRLRNVKDRKRSLTLSI